MAKKKVKEASKEKKEGRGKDAPVEEVNQHKKLLDDIRVMSDEMKKDRRAVNNIAILLQHLQPKSGTSMFDEEEEGGEDKWWEEGGEDEATESEEDRAQREEVVFRLLRALTGSFSHFYSPYAKEQVVAGLLSMKEAKEDEEKIPTAEDKFIHWLNKHLVLFLRLSFTYLTSTQPTLQTAVVRSFFTIYQPDHLLAKDDMRADLMRNFIRRLLHNKNLSEPLVQSVLAGRLNEHGDLLLHFVNILQTYLEQISEKIRAKTLPSTVDVDTFCENVWLLIKGLPTPTVGLFQDRFFIEAEPSIGNGKKRKRTSEMEPVPEKKAKEGLKSCKKVINQVFINFFKLPLPPSIYKSVLHKIHTDVFPKLTQPLFLCDFLTDSYNAGGVVSLLALNGLFVLITKHNLSYPHFYDKLYQLFTPTICYARYRSQFFSLSSLFLSSRHIPAVSVAAFIKKMGRIAMQAPPHAALVLLAMMYNLFVRHPSCQILLHRDRKEKKPDFVLMLGAPSEAEKKEEEAKEEEKAKGGSGDPFRPNVKQPAKSRAIESSLWEITALRSHYSPTVARFVQIFDKPLAEKRQTIDLSDFLTCSYTSLFDAEIKKQAKVVPLEHDKCDDLFDPGPLFDSPVFRD